MIKKRAGLATRIYTKAGKLLNKGFVRHVASLWAAMQETIQSLPVSFVSGLRTCMVAHPFNGVGGKQTYKQRSQT